MSDQEGAYPAWGKTPRWNSEVIVTEKIDGTNALIEVGEDGTLRAGSRHRWLTEDKDNFGFAKWVAENAEMLRRLGPGRHYGEWWGKGIQRGYGLEERRFSLFWSPRYEKNLPPDCCHMVPVLRRMTLEYLPVSDIIHDLSYTGSWAAPGFLRPEGIIIQTQGMRWKRLIENPDGHKGQSSE